MVNRTQALVIGFFLLVVVSLVAVLAAAPEVYDQALRLPAADRGQVEAAFLAALAMVAGYRRAGPWGAF